MKTLSLLLIGLLISGVSHSQIVVKKISVLILLILFSTTINSQVPDNEIIKDISQNWANSHGLNTKIANIICKTVDDEPLLYIVNFKKGWVMISADESLNTILGFSFDSNYSEENEADGVKSLFEFYGFVKKKNIAHNIKFTNERDALSSGNYKSANNIEKVEPLVPVSWNQDWPYNAYCPPDDDMPDNFNGHHNTSCGPAAFAQILRYWRYPVHGTGYHSYVYDNPGFALLGFVEADYESTYYNWDNMPASLNFNDPESVYTDIATLMQNVGVSVEGAWSSGGQLFQYSAAAVKYFGYSPNCEVYYRNDFTTEEWHAVFRNDLDNGRPIMMVGPGHYFVCDGYYGSDFYHINWGWGPGSDGYYPLYHLGNYALNNWALIGLEPNYQNKKLKMNDPYTVDDSTVVLLHFDGNLTNQSSLSDNPNEHGTISFADNSELGLGQCLYLNNTSQGNRSFLDIADNNNLDLSSDWTIEMWFKPTSFGTSWYENFTLLNKPGDNNIFESNYSIYMLPASHWLAPEGLNFSFYPSGEPEHFTTNINTDKYFLELGKWYHLTYIRNASTNTLKVVIHNSDKELIYYASRPTETTALPLLNSNPLFIGSGNQSNTYFDGYIDELRISNVVRKFEITGSGLTLLTPNGGEKWGQNTTQQISWEDNNSDNLKIEYTTDNGQSWNEIISSAPSDTGFYNWTLPNINSDRCKIKITDVNDINVYDESNRAFSIKPYEITLKSPNGGEYYISGDSALISWEDTPVSEIKIEYSSDNGSKWNLITNSTPTSLGTYDWIIPDIRSGQCKIRITDISNASVLDESSTFEIGPANNAGGPYAVDDHTVLLLHFDGNLKEEAHNHTLNNHGIEKSYITNSVSGLNDAIYFDNSDQGNQSFLTVPYTSELSLSSNWTIDFWLRINSWDQSNNSWPVPILLPTVGWDANYFLEIPSTEGRLKYGFKSSDGGAMIYSSQGSITTNTWYHIALINDYDNHTIKLILRDTDFKTLEEQSFSYTAGTVISTGTQDLRIGNGLAGDNYLDGYMDELRISNVVRTFENTTGISENAYGSLISIYPNPADHNVFISAPETVDLAIFSLTGQKVIERKDFLNGNIDVSYLNKGIYIIRFSCDKGIENRKLIIE